MLGLLAHPGKEAGVTRLGRRAAELGLAPRLAALVLEGIDRGAPGLAAACAALLADRDGSGIPADPDVRLRLEMLRAGVGERDAWRRATRAEAGRLLRRAGVPIPAAGPEGLLSWTAAEEEGVGDLLAHAFPDRIARREQSAAVARPGEMTWRFVTGRAARFPSVAGAPPVSRAAAEWITAVETDAGESIGTIRLAAPVDPAEAARVLGPVTEQAVEVRWDGLVPRAVRVTRAGRLVLAERPGRVPAREAGASFLERLSRAGTGLLPWDAACTKLLERLRFFASRPGGEGLGDISDAGLASRAGQWLAPHLDFSGGPVLTGRSLHAALAGLLELANPRVGRHGFDEAVPDSLRLPLGGRRQIDYSSGSPVVEARIQEVYGLSASPRICGLALAFRLLSPAGRPLQVTADLAGFWKGSYAEVRKMMRGRYPKHDWPEDPSSAAPSSGPRRRPPR
jgi:ATP-dependent helicase HrpB